VTAPTGTAPNVDKAVDIPTGDGQWDAGATIVGSYLFPKTPGILPQVELAAFGGYNVQFADSIERRIPESADDRLSEDKEVVDRDLGDQLSAGGSVTFGNTRRGFSFGLGYTYQFMSEVAYSGSKYSVARYRYLSNFDQPEQEVHSATLMATFATIEWFKEGKFFYPFQAQLAWSRPFAGRNVGTADVVSAELVLFF
ncbi:MAG: hypothetical protein IT285_11085, partial [Bdellovibrionales bacterium]|nr:hypothetical protein [Bdellovibrionales bacterium]